MPPLGRKLRSFGALSPKRRRLVLRAILLCGAFRLALWFVPFRWIRRFAGKPVAQTIAEDPREIALAVTIASRYVWHATCLTQALAAQHLLNRAGTPNLIRIGVKCGDSFEAHAWVECDGRIVIGDEQQSAQFQPMLTLETALIGNGSIET